MHIFICRVFPNGCMDFEFWNTENQTAGMLRFLSCGGRPSAFAHYWTLIGTSQEHTSSVTYQLEKVAVEHLCAVWSSTARANNYGLDVDDTSTFRRFRRRSVRQQGRTLRPVGTLREQALALSLEQLQNKFVHWCRPTPWGRAIHLDKSTKCIGNV